jgi:hypothetical protein
MIKRSTKTLCTCSREQWNILNQAARLTQRSTASNQSRLPRQKKRSNSIGHDKHVHRINIMAKHKGTAPADK